MAYDHELAGRIRGVVGRRPGVSEKEMFGGVAFLLEGKMFIGIVKDDLMVRVGPDAHQEALAQAHVRPMDFVGRPMKGYVYVEPAGCKSDASLRRWIDQAQAFAATLPAKKTKGGGKSSAATPRKSAATPRKSAATPRKSATGGRR